MATIGIYVIRNVRNGRVYVGSSVNLKQRWNAHRSALRKGTHHAPFLQASWTKHGEAAFAFEVIEAHLTRDALLHREQYWIDELKAFGPGGLNGYPSAGSPRGSKGKKLGPEHLAKTRAILAARNKSPEMRAIIVQRNKSPKMRAITIARNKSPEMREAVKKPRPKMRGKLVTAQTRQRLSAAKRGVPHSEAHRETLLAALVRDPQTGRWR